MSARLRSARPLALAFVVASLAVARPAHAQSAALAPAPATALVSSAEPTPAPVGPTLDAASVGVRHQAVETTAAARRSGMGQAEALMIVGGAAVLVGLLIGGGAGSAIAVGGAIVGLVGLYEYLQ
ncbi:MAG: hypothetical protein M3Z10_10725 [Gemmatimonadota bacterium]|nr:hypothetical protein [Gemmatimonadota bacterium]